MSDQPQDLTDVKMPELRKLAATLDIPAPVGTTKVALIAAIEAKQGPPSPPEAKQGAIVAPEDVPAGVVPGETPGWPTDGEGNALYLTDEQRAQLAEKVLDGEDQSDDPDHENPDEADDLKLSDATVSVGGEKLPATLVSDDAPEGYVRETREVEVVNDRGDWLCPFSGLRVHYASNVCAQSGAQRDGDEAWRLVPDEG